MAILRLGQVITQYRQIHHSATRRFQRRACAGAETIIDIGGGYGSLLLPILTHYPTARGVLFDLPDAYDTALFQQKLGAVYQHIYEHYASASQNTYAQAA